MAKTATKSVFGSAPVAPVAAKASTSKLDSFPITGIADFQALRTLEAMIKSARLDAAAVIQHDADDHFIDLGVVKRKRPENFVGVEGSDSVTMVYAKRASTSPLSPEEVELLKAHEVPVEEVTNPETYSFNPTYIDDPKWRAKIEAALARIPDLPEDVIFKSEATTRYVVGEDTIDAIFVDDKAQPRDKGLIASLLPLVTRFGPKAKGATVTDISALLQRVGAILKLPNMEEKMTAAMADPDKVLSKDFGTKATKKKAA